MVSAKRLKELERLMNLPTMALLLRVLGLERKQLEDLCVALHARMVAYQELLEKYEKVEQDVKKR